MYVYHVEVSIYGSYVLLVWPYIIPLPSAVNMAMEVPPYLTIFGSSKTEFYSQSKEISMQKKVL